ncbi:MAG: hypothetical protein AB7F39_03545 [Variibacter sp.]
MPQIKELREKREIADEHSRDDTFPCGWQPSTSADVEALQSALAALSLCPGVMRKGLQHDYKTNLY